MTNMTPSPELVERVARALAGHFGPVFDDLPRDRVQQREFLREGGNPAENTQEDCLEAARAAIEATHLEEVVRALEPFVPHYEEWMKDEATWPDETPLSVFRGKTTFGQLRKARALLAALTLFEVRR
jgi:hypothetical protein